MVARNSRSLICTVTKERHLGEKHFDLFCDVRGELIVLLQERRVLAACDVDPFRKTFHVAVAQNMVVGCAGSELHGNVAVVQLEPEN